MLTKVDLDQISNVIDARNKTLEVTLKAEIKASEERTKNEIRRVEAGLKRDIHDLQADVTKKIKSHDRRINTLEDELDIPHPDKN
jgi:hypothetical protein